MFRGVILICKLTSYTCKTELSCRLCNLIFSGNICGLRVRSMPLVKTNGNEFCLNRTLPPSEAGVGYFDLCLGLRSQSGDFAFAEE